MPDPPAQAAVVADAPPAVIPGIKPPDKFILGPNPIESWKLFKQRWDSYAILTNLSARPHKVQVALLTSRLADDALKRLMGSNLTLLRMLVLSRKLWINFKNLSLVR